MHRTPQIGDLLIVACPSTDYYSHCSCHQEGERHVGIVREIEKDTWGHQRNVRIEWSSKAPVNYRDEHGYSGTNIHNFRSEFTIIRDGEEVVG